MKKRNLSQRALKKADESEVKLPRIRERAESMQKIAVSENGGSPVRRSNKASAAKPKVDRTRSPQKHRKEPESPEPTTGKKKSKWQL